MLATIPYKTFPKIALGPIELRTFGVMVGLGVLIGAWVAARYIEEHTGVVRDETYRLATRLVVGGVIGARITWDLSHTNQIHSALDLIAVWKGGLQFSGGFIAAVIIGFPTFRKWTRSVRWSNLDGYAYGLTIGLAFGRVGCTSVGEHFGSHSTWWGAVEFRGGTTREPAAIGATFHNTAIYELVYLLVLFGILTLVIRRRPAPGTMMGIFCLYYGVSPRAVGLPAGQRQDGGRAHRRAMDVRRAHTDVDLDPHEGAQGHVRGRASDRGDERA